MTTLLTLRDNIKEIYSRYDFIFTPIVKFIFAFILLININGSTGYFATLNSTFLIFVISVICAIIPIEFLTGIGGMFIILHSAKVSLDVGIVAVVLVIIFYCGFMRFSPKAGVVVFLVPLFYSLHIMYALPILVGFLVGPSAVFPAVFGVMLYYYENELKQLVNVLATQVDDENAVAGYQYIMDALIKNKEMLLIMAVFACIILITYAFHCMSFEHSWLVSFLAGGFLNVVLFLVGSVALSIEIETGSVIIGSVVGILLAVVIQFFKGVVDYQKTELLQFEDDQYYYYVKAIPKLSVSMSNRNVKHINSKTQK